MQTIQFTELLLQVKNLVYNISEEALVPPRRSENGGTVRRIMGLNCELSTRCYVRFLAQATYTNGFRSDCTATNACNKPSVLHSFAEQEVLFSQFLVAAYYQFYDLFSIIFAFFLVESSTVNLGQDHHKVIIRQIQIVLYC